MTEPALGGLSLDEAERAIYAHIVSRSPEHDFEPTLDRMRDACDLLGDPQRAYRVVHLTGTNGKTSTARMTESLIRAHGLRTGLFTSPHLSSVRERIQIDGEPIGQQAFVDLWAQVAPIIQLADARSAERGGPRLSFFEVFTVLAFAAFADAPVDVAVIEVGIGGSWDATNVADGEVAVIGPVSLDHQQYLGSELAGIAREKSGIIKPGAAVVVAMQAPSADLVLRSAVAAAGARASWEDDDIEVMTRVPAEESLVVDRDRGDDGDLAVGDVRRVPRATHPDLDHGDVDRCVGEGCVGHRHEHLEERHERPVVLDGPVVHEVDVGDDLLVGLDEPLCADRLTVQRDPLPHVLQVRADESAGPQTLFPQQGLDHSGGRGLPVRAGEVDHAEGVLGVAQQVADRGDPIQAGHEVVLRGPVEDLPVDLVEPLGDVGGPGRGRGVMLWTAAGLLSRHAVTLALRPSLPPRPLPRHRPW